MVVSREVKEVETHQVWSNCGPQATYNMWLMDMAHVWHIEWGQKCAGLLLPLLQMKTDKVRREGS